MTDYSSEDFWKGAPDWAGAVIAGDDGSRYWVAEWGIKSARQRLGMNEIDRFEADMTSAASAWSLIATRPAPPWSGDGLPPVGTVCEFKDHARGSWAECTIIGEFRDRIICGCNQTGAVGYIDLDDLRPIKTPAQIAAEEREVFARTLAFEMGKDPDSSPNSIAQGRRMYDLGYRRTEKGGDK